MIKTFEAFNINPDSFEENKILRSYSDDYSDKEIHNMISDINLLYNFTTVRKDEINKIYSLVHDGLNGGQVYNWLVDTDNTDTITAPNFNLEKSEKNKIINTYNKLYRTYHLEKLPDIYDIDDILLILRDLTEVEMVINISQFIGIPTLIFDIDTIPDINTFPNPDEFEIDLDKYDEIVSEVKPAVNRIKDLGYKVTTKLSKFGEIKILVTR